MTDPAAPEPVATASWMRRLAEDEAPSAAPSPWGPVIILVLSLLWLGGILRAAGATIANNGGDASIAISSAALSLPGILTAVLLAGAAAGLLLVVRFAERGGPGPTTAEPSTTRRILVGAAGGAVIGLATGALVLSMFGANRAIVVIAVTIAIAGVAGGAVTALRSINVTAGITATLSVYVFSTVINLFQGPLKRLLGAGETAASQFGAASRLAFATAMLGGLVAGLVAYVVLQRGRGLAWPWFLLAGAFPGILALAAEGLTLVGGSGLLGIVSAFSPADKLVLSYLSGERLRSALIITFVGGIVAMIAVGRTLRHPED